MVMAQSLFKRLKKDHPSSVIDVLAPGWSRSLTDRMPEVRQAIDMPIGHGRLGLAERWRLGRSLRGQYDWSILLPNSWKSALIPYAAQIPKRTGWLGEFRYGLLNDTRRLDKKRLSMTVQRFVALADIRQLHDSDDSIEVQPPLLDVRLADIHQAMQALSLKKQARRRVLGLCPGAEYGPAKRWPAASFGGLARQYHEAGWDIWLFGSGKDRAVCDAVNQAAEGCCIDLCGHTSLSQAVDIMAFSDAVVSNDSGLMHIAAALNKPLVAIYGSSDPSFTPPLNQQHAIVYRQLECSPCFERECPLGHLNCLKGLEVAQVRDALSGLVG